MLEPQTPWLSIVIIVTLLISFSFMLGIRLVYRKTLKASPSRQRLIYNAIIFISLAALLGMIEQLLVTELAIGIRGQLISMAIIVVVFLIGVYYLYKIIRYHPL